VVEAAARSKVAIEVSSAGLRRKGAEVFPAPDFLNAFATAGVPITLASDAHAPEDAGWGHDDVVVAARAAGYKSYLRFEKQQRIATPLPATGPSQRSSQANP